MVYIFVAVSVIMELMGILYYGETFSKMKKTKNIDRIFNIAVKI